jgi:hypothetical protein
VARGPSTWLAGPLGAAADRRHCRIGGGQEVGDLLPAGVAGRLGLGNAGLVAGLRGQHQGHRAGDVLVQQGGELVAGGLAEVRHDRRPDVVLVLLQPAQRRAGVGQRLAVGAADGADDGEPRPGDVVLRCHSDPALFDEIAGGSAMVMSTRPGRAINEPGTRLRSCRGGARCRGRA